MADDLFAALWSGVAIWLVAAYVPVNDVLAQFGF
jgi:hypothetical protein